MKHCAKSILFLSLLNFTPSPAHSIDVPLIQWLPYSTYSWHAIGRWQIFVCLRWRLYLSRSKTGILGSNPSKRMDYVRTFLCFVILCCVGRGLAMGWTPVQEFLPKCLNGFIISGNDSELEEATGSNPWRAQQKQQKLVLTQGKRKILWCSFSYRKLMNIWDCFEIVRNE